jgi:uncharacterized protein (TIGR03083 family)
MPRSVPVVGHELIAHEKFCDAAAEEIELFGAALRGVAPETRCVTCTDWNVRELAEHLGGVHRWAATMVRDVAQERATNVDLGLPTDDYARWIAEGGALLTGALRAVDPDAPMWSWGADKRARFWSRRQLHETAIHRADLELSLGRAPRYEDWVAADGVDEFLENLPHARRFAPNVDALRGDGERIGVRAGDAAWTIQLLPDRFEWARSSGPADVTVSGSPGDAYLFVWGRRAADDMDVTGDEDLLRRWVKNSSI